MVRDEGRAAGRSADRMRRLAGIGLAAALAICGAAAHAQNWEPAASGSAAILPPPDRASGVVGASFACAGQRWSLLLRTGEAGAGRMVPGNGRVAIDGGQAFPGEAVRASGTIRLAVPNTAIAPIRAGLRLEIAIEGEAGPAEALFSLRGSRRTIEAIEPLCSPREIEGFDIVAMSPTDRAVPAARAVRAAEIEAFKIATQSEPEVSARIETLPEGKALLFVRLCGSSWYFGRTGCNVASYARAMLLDDWRLVYDDEGGTIHLAQSPGADGWPDIVRVPRGGGGEESLWAWNGSDYALREGVAALD